MSTPHNTIKRLVLQERELEFMLKRNRRARRLRITVYGGGRVVVTIPYYTPERDVERFVRRKANWLVRTLVRMAPTNPGLLLPPRTRSQYELHKQLAHQLVGSRIDALNAHYGLPFRSVRIRNQHTLWGSCSAKGDLSFNYQLVFLPEKLVDYIIVHELCHVRELNHSKQFWSLVGRTIPDHRDLRNELRSLIIRHDV